MYTENDNIDWEAVEKYRQLPMEELDRILEEEERKVRERLNCRKPANSSFIHSNDVNIATPATTNNIHMKVKYIQKSNVSLTQGKTYEVISIEEDWYRIIDDTEDDYLFDPEDFEIVEN